MGSPFRCPLCGIGFSHFIGKGDYAACPFCFGYIDEGRARQSAQPQKKSRRPPGTLSRRRRRQEKVFERDGRRCVECGATGRLTVDHIVPRSKGGTDALENLQTMCSPCNGRKGDSLPDAAVAVFAA
jgi:5-methylcytosine-specific restriction endonuclease McrA